MSCISEGSDSSKTPVQIILKFLKSCAIVCYSPESSVMELGFAKTLDPTSDPGSRILELGSWFLTKCEVHFVARRGEYATPGGEVGET